mmetsp:Transcript_22670/g.63084  ORF Transcript_22670/g.63084 Transcript_22670/m.63084 type:complete len:299 (-) Transcript_22670:1101-1997(-)
MRCIIYFVATNIWCRLKCCQDQQDNTRAEEWKHEIVQLHSEGLEYGGKDGSNEQCPTLSRGRAAHNNADPRHAAPHGQGSFQSSLVSSPLAFSPRLANHGSHCISYSDANNPELAEQRKRRWGQRRSSENLADPERGCAPHNQKEVGHDHLVTHIFPIIEKCKIKRLQQGCVAAHFFQDHQDARSNGIGQGHELGELPRDGTEQEHSNQVEPFSGHHHGGFALVVVVRRSRHCQQRIGRVTRDSQHSNPIEQPPESLVPVLFFRQKLDQPLDTQQGDELVVVVEPRRRKILSGCCCVR